MTGMRHHAGADPEQVFDVLIIGGGITGAWTALDCSLRGMSTALIEKNDFGSATSMRSSRLLHGGIRYLQQLELAKVRESSRERAFLIRCAPHMVEHLPFIVPTYRGLRQGRGFLFSGMLAYRLLTLGTQAPLTDPATRIPADKALSREQTLAEGLLNSERITGGRVLYEAQMHSSERMTFSVIDTARAFGATTLNYVAMENYCITDHKVTGVQIRNHGSGESNRIQARLVINAAGPWCDSLNQPASLQKLNSGFARGAHIITRPLLGNYAVALPSAFRADGIATRGNRHVFVIPWRGCSLIGTSYLETDAPSEAPTATDSEIDQLIETINAALPQANLSRADIRQSFAGYYPLQSPAIQHGVYQGTGEYQLVDHSVTDHLDGLITALGAKFTTGRRLGELAAQLAEKKLGRASVKSPANPTRRVCLRGGDIADLASFRADCLRRYQVLWSESTCQHLISNYGSRIHEIANLCQNRPDLAQPLVPDRDTIGAQVVWAAQQESVVHLADILFRRTDLCLLGDPGDTVLAYCAQLAGAALEWDREKQRAELELVRIELARSIPTPGN